MPRRVVFCRTVLIFVKKSLAFFVPLCYTVDMQTIDRPAVGEINGLPEGSNYHSKRGRTRTVPWTAKGLRITRFRILSDPGFPFWDVSYCHGKIGDENVDVSLPFFQMPKYGWKKFIVKYAIKDKVFAKGLGIFENVSSLC